jgi:hypothetical protein
MLLSGTKEGNTNALMRERKEGKERSAHVQVTQKIIMHAKSNE